jgi:hypothetical protein
MTDTLTTPINAHAWQREVHEHYVEPHWCSERLFAEEKFDGPIWDPCCGFGRIVDAAVRAGYLAVGTDIVDRGYRDFGGVNNFLQTPDHRAHGPAIVCNPPFKIVREFALHALSFAAVQKVAMIFPTRRLNAAHWLHGTPLARVWLMTPRPSMPPGHTIATGKKVKGGIPEFCWLIWTKGRVGPASIQWLRRDA